jgi:tetratricopeptide (TPR) repeat protein
MRVWFQPEVMRLWFPRGAGILAGHAGFRAGILAFCVCFILAALSSAAQSDLEIARDHQDRAALDTLAEQAGATEQKADNDAAAHYRAALAYSYLAEVAQEQRDKSAVKRAAESGIRSAERAVAMKPDVAEYRRILGTLYGQIVPVNVLLGLSYGKKSQDSIAKAIELDPKSSAAYVSRGVGNYYVPSGLGGGLDLAIRDFQKALELNPKSDEAWLWLGLAMRKANRNVEARKAFSKSLELNPNRVWTKQQLDKTPAN